MEEEIENLKALHKEELEKVRQKYKDKIALKKELVEFLTEKTYSISEDHETGNAEVEKLVLKKLSQELNSTFLLIYLLLLKDTFKCINKANHQIRQNIAKILTKLGHPPKRQFPEEEEKLLLSSKQNSSEELTIEDSPPQSQPQPQIQNSSEPQLFKQQDLQIPQESSQTEEILREQLSKLLSLHDSLLRVHRTTQDKIEEIGKIMYTPHAFLQSSFPSKLSVNAKPFISRKAQSAFMPTLSAAVSVASSASTGAGAGASVAGASAGVGEEMAMPPSSEDELVVCLSQFQSLAALDFDMLISDEKFSNRVFLELIVSNLTTEGKEERKELFLLLKKAQQILLPFANIFTESSEQKDDFTFLKNMKTDVNNLYDLFLKIPVKLKSLFSKVSKYEKVLDFSADFVRNIQVILHFLSLYF
jgi:hypothetical protein